MISFVYPWAFAFLLAPIIIYLLPAKQRNQSVPLVVPTLLKADSFSTGGKPNKKGAFFTLIAIWCLVISAASQPQWLGEPINIPTEGREMMLAVDLSGSMQVEDMSLNGSTVNRLDMLKVVLGDFIERRTGDKLGLILFADDAYMQTPMTFDRKTVKQMLDETVLGLVGKQTAIGDAIALAVKRFDEKEKSNKVLLLLTDGQNTAGKILPAEALELAKAKDVTIYSIGIGADVMLQRSIFGSRKVNPSSELDEDTLTQLAQETGGRYFRAKNTQEMEQIYQLLDELEPIEQEQEQMRPLRVLFHYPLALALMLALLHLLWSNVQSKLSVLREK